MRERSKSILKSVRGKRMEVMVCTSRGGRKRLHRPIIVKMSMYVGHHGLRQKEKTSILYVY